ncbi:peptidylprolyl isomerase [Carboxylicivirga linearis]|uniref:peptidylprolyl isomerase n=1 Tax=Carboxylicivirga linearis TaxID=1628157 RepID=A0ABS5JTD9_9BACT|nr:peptidylprolyl isomerase [Carboxylicivirga linearis]MBS2098132.1 peptidylprolyl isomerase [Carboxylicivirga linearis]
MKSVLFGLLIVLLFQSCKSDPQIIIKTELGEIVCDIYIKDAPITAGNFLKYVDEGRFEGATFYRVVTMDNQPDNDIKIEVVQGGLYDDVHPNHLPPIEHETTKQTGILHKDGVFSMARNEPGTAQADFFFCIGDQPELDFGGKRNPDGQGFSAFGKVVSGMDVLLKIHERKNEEQYLINPVKILAIERN